MKRLFQWFLLYAAVAGFAPLTSNAQVTASLVAQDASIQPGKPFTVALRLQHEPGWHTYWLNPGTGLPTKLTWKLPPGFVATDIQWPAPHVVKDKAGTVTGNGFEGDLLLPVTITPPTSLASQTVSIAATANWLMCEEVCIPDRAEVSLTLPVLAQSPKPDVQWGAPLARVVAELPRTLPEWSVTATRSGDTVTLAVSSKEAGGHVPEGLHFFSDDKYIGYELSQDVKRESKSRQVLTLRVGEEAPDPRPDRLLGVLVADNGWKPDGSQRALRIDVPFSKRTASVAPTMQSDTTASSSGPPENVISSVPVTEAPSIDVMAPVLRESTVETSPPRVTASEPMPVVSVATSTRTRTASEAPRTSLWVTLGLAVLGGLILNLMPCVFPVLGIKVLGFVQQAGAQRRSVVTHGLTFTAGVLLSFWALAALLAALRSGGAALGWGFQLQSPAFVFVLAVVMLIFALNLSGVFEFGLRATSVGSNLLTKSGYGGSFFTGVLATIVATPCSAPFLAPALGAALTLSVAQSFAVFTAIAIGLSIPYLALSLFPGAIQALPRPGAWMETFKQFMAFPLYATVGYLVWVLAGQVSEDALLAVLFGLTLIALGVWVYGRWHTFAAKPMRARLSVVGCVLISALGVSTGWPKAAAPSEVVWEAWSPARVEQLRSEGRPIYVDFTARWCATCQANKKVVFGSKDVLATFAKKNVATLKADWTNEDPQITAELARWGRNAVPFNLVYLPGRSEPTVLPELLTPNIVLEALK